MAPPRTCGTCGRIDCQQHRRTSWRHAVPTLRIRGRRLQRLRNQLFSREPLCVQCLQEGRTTIAMIRDHIIPLAEGGRDDETNEQPICEKCHDSKTAQEAKRGLSRYHGGVWKCSVT